jgi:hypothetical protein
MINALIAKNDWEPAEFEMPEGLLFRQVPATGAARPARGMREEVFLPGNDRGTYLETDWSRPDW